MGRNGGHQWGDSVAAYGEVFMATVSRHRARTFDGTQLLLATDNHLFNGQPNDHAHQQRR
jgi:hypothetical protein